MFLSSMKDKYKESLPYLLAFGYGPWFGEEDAMFGAVVAIL